MRILTYKELRECTTDELLDLLSNYLYLRKDTIINKDKNSLINYELNIRKIENELIVRAKNN